MLSPRSIEARRKLSLYENNVMKACCNLECCMCRGPALPSSSSRAPQFAFRRCAFGSALFSLDDSSNTDSFDVFLLILFYVCPWCHHFLSCFVSVISLCCTCTARLRGLHIFNFVQLFPYILVSISLTVFLFVIVVVSIYNVITSTRVNYLIFDFLYVH